MSTPRKPTWTWDIYYAELAKDQRRATRAAAKAAPKETPPPGIPTADRTSGCEGQAPEGPKGPVAGSLRTPECLPIVCPSPGPIIDLPDDVRADPRSLVPRASLPAPSPRRDKIKLTGLPSSMEQLAESWKGNT